MFELMPFLELQPSPFSVIGHGGWHLAMLLIQDPVHSPAWQRTFRLYAERIGVSVDDIR
jgi:hypothetical protein